MTTAVDPDAPWQTRAACGPHDVGVMYPRTEPARDKALAICYRCPVQPQCLSDAERMPPLQQRVGMVRGGRWWPKGSDKTSSTKGARRS